MIFVIEGADGSGKTTLMNSIKADKRQQSFFLACSSRPKSISEIKLECDWIDALPPDATLFMDRYRIISEMVYGPILRGQSLIEHPINWENTPERYRFIYCRPPYANITENIKVQYQIAGIPEHIDPLVRAYDRLFLNVERYCPVLRYDYTHHLMPAFLDRIYELNK